MSYHASSTEPIPIHTKNQFCFNQVGQKVKVPEKALPLHKSIKSQTKIHLAYKVVLS